MNKKQLIGYQIHSLDHMIGRLIHHYQAQITGREQITKMQNWIIGYLYANQGRDIFQKDIEREFRIARSTATGILKLMEKNRLLVREAYPSDARLKRLVLTERGAALHCDIIRSTEKIEDAMKQNLTKEQLENFFSVINILHENIKNELNCTRKETDYAEDTTGSGEGI